MHLMPGHQLLRKFLCSGDCNARSALVRKSALVTDADAQDKVSQSKQGSYSPKSVTLQAALDRSVRSARSKQEVIWWLLQAGPEVRRGVAEMCAYLEGFAGDAATELAARLDNLSVSSTSAAGNGTQQPSEHSDPVIEQALGVPSSPHT